MTNLNHNGEIESINGEKWSWESDGPPLVDKMDIVEALAPLLMALHYPLTMRWGLKEEWMLEVTL